MSEPFWTRTAAWERFLPLTGVVFVVLFVVAFILYGDTPKLDASAEDVRAFFQDDRGRVLTGSFVFGLGAVFYLWFLGTLASAFASVGEPRLGRIAFAAGIVLVPLAFGFAVISGGLAFTVAEDADPGITQAIYNLEWALTVMISFPVAALVAATSFGILRSRLLPDWFGWVGLVAALALLLGGTTWAKDGFWAPDGVYTAWITTIVFLLWFLVLSFLLFRRGPVGEAATAQAARPARAA